VQRLLREEPLLRRASTLSWPQLQRLISIPEIERVLDFSAAVSHVLGEGLDNLDLCNRLLELPQELLNPPYLISGEDLKLLGLKPGPTFKLILERVRDAQLESLVNTTEEALQLARKLASELPA
jgi:poly(A) polymerase